ncbi:MAG TPA: hypothetical protein PLJ44_07050 [Victivallales bacterium]|nr:hypothetical protein [Victivallales bacterium]
MKKESKPINMSLDIQKIKQEGFVRYSYFGAKGDGKTDDMEAIVATHDFANKHSLDVKADKSFKYYVGGKNLTAIIMTNTDFGDAEFIIDDRAVERRQANIFDIVSEHKSFKIDEISSIKKNQNKLEINLTQPSILIIKNSTLKQFIRYGLNKNNGFPQTDVIIVDANGNIFSETTPIWDFNQITEVTAFPIDSKTLLINGGIFTTIANNAESKYNYYKRGIGVKRSNVIINGLKHKIVEEGDNGAPYGGFLNIEHSSNIKVIDSVFTGHKIYETIGSAGKKVSMGTYDLTVDKSINISFVNCKQFNDIDDKRYWGILGSNYCKNIVYDNCVFSRFDAHMGVTNVTIRNSTLGHQGINAIGNGTLLLEKSEIRGNSLINLRSDYGSTWNGIFIIRDCIFIPNAGKKISSVNLVNGRYSGQHNFGYQCYMPEKIFIENLKIDDKNHTDEYRGPAIFADFNPEMRDSSYKENFPYVITKEVITKNLNILSGKPIRISENIYMFRNVKLKQE